MTMENDVIRVIKANNFILEQYKKIVSLNQTKQNLGTKLN
jgi:hypothetical protein